MQFFDILYHSVYPHADINECAEDNGGCTARCINVPGSYACTCEQDHIWASENKSCIPRSMSKLLFSKMCIYVSVYWHTYICTYMYTIYMYLKLMVNAEYTYVCAVLQGYSNSGLSQNKDTVYYTSLQRVWFESPKYIEGLGS